MGKSNGQDADNHLRLQALMLEYEQGRTDEREFLSSQTVALSVGVAVLAATVALAQDASDYPPAVVAAMPMAAVAFLSWVQYLGAVASLRSFHLRALEREIRTLGTPATWRNMSSYPGLRPLSWSEVHVGYSAVSRRGSPGGALMRGLLVAGIVIVFGFVTLYLITLVGWEWRVLMVAVYGPMIMLLAWEAVSASSGGRSFFAQSVKRAARRQKAPLSPPASSGSHHRRLFSYLLLPRPLDALTKPLITLGGIVVAAAAAPPRYSDWLPVMLGVLLFEFLLYQSRYQWNDIRGVDEDVIDPTAAARGRLPGGRANAGWSFATLLARLFLFLWLIALWSSIAGRPLLPLAGAAMLLVYFHAALYEALRTVGRSGRAQEGWVAGALVLTVCLGYPIRFLIGYGIAWAIFSQRPEVPVVHLAAWAVAFTALGLIFIGPTWLMEGFKYARHDASADGWRPGVVPLGKQHVVTLALAHGGLRAGGSDEAPVAHDATSGVGVKVLREQTLRYLSLHRLGAIFWFIAIAFREDTLMDAAPLLVGAALAFIPGGNGILGSFAASAGALMTALVLLWSFEVRADVLVLVSSLIPGLLMLSFRNMSYADVNVLPEKLAKMVRRSANRAWILLRGW